MAVQMYKDCMEPHIKNDSVHTREEVTQVEKHLNGASTQILRAFKFGESWGQEDRFKSACQADNNEIASLNQLVKTHKTNLCTRPVCRAPVKQATTGGLTEIACDIISPFAEEADKIRRTEITSTEDLCSEMKMANERIMKDGLRRGPFQRDGNLVIGSKDVNAMYPEMDIDVVAEETRLEIQESDLEIEVNTGEMALFLACSMTQEEIDGEGLTDLVHSRRHKRGPRPGLTCKAITGDSVTRAKDQSWLPAKREPGDKKEKMKMVGCLVKNVILLVMKNNFYTFDNIIRKQIKGGAIGNKLTERLGKIFMKRFDTKYLKLCVDLGIKHELYGRYVDDKTEGLVATDPGVRFDGEKLVKHEEWEDEDMGICEDVRTFRILKEIGDTIFKCVKFTFDCPSLQPSKGQNEEMVPVLDLKCYVVGEQFVHEYYEKKTACRYTIPYSSAHSDKMKMAVLVEDGLRRLRNYSQGLEWEKKRLVNGFLRYEA